jgi:SAM-dependent methyltransferase
VASTATPPPSENAYGHLKRVDWIRSHLHPGDRIAEVGCGTGYRVTFPLRLEGKDVIGIDIDGPSIRLGRTLFEQAGLDPGLLVNADLEDVAGSFDVVILSEVLEHLSDEDRCDLLAIVREKLVPGGRVLVTVPNGYGWYELESFLWKRARIGGLLERAHVAGGIARAKGAVLRETIEDPIPSSLSESPHVQRFTPRRIRAALRRSGFEPYDFTGSVLFAGPFSNLLLTGISTAMRANNSFGTRFPWVAAGYYVAATRARDVGETVPKVSENAAA